MGEDDIIKNGTILELSNGERFELIVRGDIEATGIIEGYAEYAGQYVVKVNRSLWDSTNWEQRQLIRCSTETIAHKKGLKGIVLDYKLNEKLN